jgi:hypothetical protein
MSTGVDAPSVARAGAVRTKHRRARQPRRHRSGAEPLQEHIGEAPSRREFGKTLMPDLDSPMVAPCIWLARVVPTPGPRAPARRFAQMAEEGLQCPLGIAPDSEAVSTLRARAND